MRSAALKHRAKEQAENAMIVDLVRNDLSRVAQSGRVEALREIHSFPQVHQMISTASCQLGKAHSWVEALKATFPIGSMTSALKVSVLKALEAVENFKRGLYFGALGYCNPELDFDFNVVIRSLLYNARSGQLSYPVGSAITALADAEREYEECGVKFASLKSLPPREL